VPRRLSVEDFAESLPETLDRGEMIREGGRGRGHEFIFLHERGGRWFRAVVSVSKDRTRAGLLTFHTIRERQVRTIRERGERIRGSR